MQCCQKLSILLHLWRVSLLHLSPKARDARMFWLLHPGAVIGAQTSVLVPLCSVDWRAKKDQFDVTTARTWPNLETRNRAKYMRENIAVLKRFMTQRHAGWSSKDCSSKSNWQRSAIEDAKDPVEKVQIRRNAKRSRNTCTPWHREIGRPNNLSAQIRQMMQSHDTKSGYLEKAFTEIPERTRQLGWNETAKAIRVRAEKEYDEVLEFDQGEFEIVLADGKRSGLDS